MIKIYVHSSKSGVDRLYLNMLDSEDPEIAEITEISLVGGRQLRLDALIYKSESTRLSCEDQNLPKRCLSGSY